MAQSVGDLLSAWEDFRIEAEEYRELDDERVLVLHYISGRGKTSGLELGQMQTKPAHLFRVCGGKVTKLLFYFDREGAFAELAPTSAAGSQRS